MTYKCPMSVRTMRRINAQRGQRNHRKARQKRFPSDLMMMGWIHDEVMYQLIAEGAGAA